MCHVEDVLLKRRGLHMTRLVNGVFVTHGLYEWKSSPNVSPTLCRMPVEVMVPNLAALKAH